MSRIFIDRPIFAWVLAIVVMLAGIGALEFLPNEQYPDIAPTQVNIRATYPGASAETIENSVTQIIEQQLTGIDGLLYFSSQSTNRGRATISAVFTKDTDPDIAQVQVQNKVQSAISRLPQSVQNQGVRVTKSNPDQLLLVAVYDATDTRSNQDVSDYLTSNIQDPLSRVESITDNRMMEQIANETGATIGGTLYSDALSVKSGPASTYLDMMRHNATTLSEALGN